MPMSAGEKLLWKPVNAMFVRRLERNLGVKTSALAERFKTILNCHGHDVNCDLLSDGHTIYFEGFAHGFNSSSLSECIVVANENA